MYEVQEYIRETKESKESNAKNVGYEGGYWNSSFSTSRPQTMYLFVKCSIQPVSRCQKIPL
jgi:hypothetical protein